MDCFLPDRHLFYDFLVLVEFVCQFSVLVLELVQLNVLHVQMILKKHKNNNKMMVFYVLLAEVPDVACGTRKNFGIKKSNFD